MNILVNGESRELTETLNLKELLDHFSLSSERIAIELNKEVVRRRDWESIIVQDADTIEIVHFVGGG